MKRQRTDEVCVIAVLARYDLRLSERGKGQRIKLMVYCLPERLGDLWACADSTADGEPLHIQHRLDGVDGCRTVPSELFQSLDCFRLSLIV